MKRSFIGDIARKFGLNPRTIRYYEKIGILPETGRSGSGYRVYSEAIIERLEFVLKAKSLGLKLDEIREILMIHDEGRVPCDCSRSLLRNRISEIGHKIAELTDLKARLQRILKVERPGSFKSICPIITDAEKNS